MELKRILAKDMRTAQEKATALYGPDVLVISSCQVRGQTEMIVAVDVVPLGAEEAVQDEFPHAVVKPADLGRVDFTQALKEAMPSRRPLATKPTTKAESEAADVNAVRSPGASAMYPSALIAALSTTNGRCSRITVKKG